MPGTKEKLRIVIVGGVAGGATAAARARRVNAQAEITILEKGPVVSFANCGLPYHLGGEIEQRSKLLVASAEMFWNRFRIGVRTQHEVKSIDREKQRVMGRTADGATFELPFDRLILSTGSEPIRPPFFAPNSKNVFHLWTLDDMDHIMAVMRERPIKRATVVGAGFVGLEVVEQLVHRGVEVALVERLPQVLGPMDREMAKMVEDELRRHGVAVHLQASIANLTNSDGVASAVNLEDGTSIPTDLVIVGAGVQPRTRLAVEAGLAIGSTGGVRVNEFMQTDDPKIYAVGDMVEYHHGVLEKAMRIPLAGPANRAGRVAGAHAALGDTVDGQASSMGSVFGTCIVRVFGLAAGSTGLNEKACRDAKIEYRAATIQAPHHASYFPGAKNLTLKIIYRAGDGKLLGAQAVGAEGCDKRLDVISTAMHFGGTIDDLCKLDLAYAPPFGSAKDPLHMAAFVAENDLRHVPTLVEFDSELDGLQVVDVRNASEIAQLPLAGAKWIPIDELAERWTELDPKRPTVTVCHSGKRAHIAACWLQGQGFADVKNLNGGVSMRILG
jgi:NADPH-dependent 2,4-dienoyl-CoA reductase/sulfur reductase-like enzyme/rhodanese-related sulfurtransferase